MNARGPLREDEAVIFLDRKEREYLRRLERGKKISIRDGKIAVEEVIGQEEGVIIRSSMNEPFLVLRPTLAQLIPNLPRQAQVIYPKDIGTVLIWADIFPGAKVIEAGVGPGALTIALLRAVGPEGRLISYEIREDFAKMARDNISRYFGPAMHWTLRVEDVSLHLDESNVDRILLDLPEPWHLVEKAWRALRPGGVLLSYLPTMLQVKTLVDALRDHGGFACIETMESLMRFWHIKGLSVRPQHRMVAHTGFITVARRVAGADKPSLFS
ncbi:MAG: tRNA (adenine-N1)-methyltransferase [Deltaproteobacteria bacterium]|nr:tRNA (adenine-N1)-methyltransferase [Deltaproteobacteria bacterium]